MTRTEVLELLADIDLDRYEIDAYIDVGCISAWEVTCKQHRKVIVDTGWGREPIMRLLEAIIEHEIARHP